MKCIAYNHRGRDGNAWIACTRRATAESVFCRTHRDAVNGVILGLWVYGSPERLSVPQPLRPSAPAQAAPLNTSTAVDASGNESVKSNEVKAVIPTP